MTPKNPTPSATAQAEHEAPGAQMAARSFARESILTAFRASSCSLDSDDLQTAGRLQTEALAAVDAAIEAALAASSAAQVAGPDGWVLVPREPTDDMYDAAVLAYRTWNEAEVRNSTFTHNDVWRAMLAAAPVTQVSKGERE